MIVIGIYRHPECARIARTRHACDWKGCIENTTATPNTRPLRMGEIVIEDFRTNEIAHGADAFDLICRQVSLYTPARWLPRVPAFRARIEDEMNGCDGDACTLPE